MNKLVKSSSQACVIAPNSDGAVRSNLSENWICIDTENWSLNKIFIFYEHVNQLNKWKSLSGGF